MGALLLSWTGLLWLRGRGGRTFRIEIPPPLASHYIQACLQLSIYVYWGLYWPQVREMAPLIAAQILFFYLLDALLSWTRGRSWRLGFGPFPILFSMNLFIWFKEDWFFLQFAMVAVSALGKEFIRWQRDGRNTHVFNPAAFGLMVASVVLIATRTTPYTLGIEISTTLSSPPQIYLHIFLLGIVVQYLFSVTLMTFSAAAALVILNLLYTWKTGTYHFIDTNIPIGVFLGLHLLVTDPSTSPRTPLGRAIFGGLYGLGTFIGFQLLGDLGVADFYDKLLMVPFLNLSVRWIDRLVRSGPLGRLTRWETTLPPRRTNFVCMSCWAVLFLVLLGTGFVQGRHPGATLQFWRKAYEEGRPDAGRKLKRLASFRAERGSAAACNILGELYMEGMAVPHNPAQAAGWFARACSRGHALGCENLARQFLFHQLPDPTGAVAKTLNRLEQDCVGLSGGRGCFLIGFAYEAGRGRPVDRTRAWDLYRHGLEMGDLDSAKGLVRLIVRGHGAAADLAPVIPALERACREGDLRSCLYLAYLHHEGIGIPRNEQLALSLLREAGGLGSLAAQEALPGPVDWAGFRPGRGEFDAPLH